MHASPLLQEFNSGPAALIMLWVIIWGLVGGMVTRYIYRRKDLDASLAMLYGTVAGAGTGPILLIYLWTKTPELKWPWIVIPSITTLGLLYWAFALYHPSNLCVTNGTYVVSQISNGILIGILYGIIAIGLTLIFSILGIVSFAHGQFYMLGGYAAFFMINKTLGAGLNPLIGILVAGLVTFIIGVIFELALLRPMHLGKVERPGEYAILLTFGLAFFLEYSALATLGANPRKVDPFFDLKDPSNINILINVGLTIIFTIGLYLLGRYIAERFVYAKNIIMGIFSLILAYIGIFIVTRPLIGIITLNFGTAVTLVAIAIIILAVGLYILLKRFKVMENRQNIIIGATSFCLAMVVAGIIAGMIKVVFDIYAISLDLSFGLPESRVVAAGLGLIVLVILLWFLNYTWLGRALRAVSQDKEAAAVVGINPLNMNTLAFGLGAMLAGLSGAALVQVLAWVPNIASLASARSFVVIVLGGMGSLPGAMVGGLIIGVVESLGVGCFPDVSRALAYQQVFGMIIFALVLLLKPTGLFGREL